MLVLENGTYLGGISGGCLEGDALRRAQKAITLGRSSVVTYDTTRDDHHQIGIGLGCNGVIDVLFTPLDPADEQNPVRRLWGLPETRTPRALTAVTACAMPNLLGEMTNYEDDHAFLKTFPMPEIAPLVLADVKKGLLEQTSRTMSYALSDGSEARIFIEIVLPAIHLVMYGGNNDIYPLGRIAKELGWKTSVVTNAHKAQKALFALADKVVHNRGEEQPLVDAYTAVILMTHDYKSDFAQLPRVLQTEARYIGMLGPRKRAQKMFDALADEGAPVSEVDMKRIYSPAGLDIGALGPEEIALSIAAEIRSCFSGRNGGSLRLRERPIH